MTSRDRVAIRLALVAVLVGNVAGSDLHLPTAMTVASATTRAGGGHAQARDEIQRSVELSPGAEVTIRAINGPVDVRTSTSRIATISITRTARTAEMLYAGSIDVQTSATSLSISGTKSRSNRGSGVSHRLSLSLPRDVNLSITGVNGSVKAGEFDGVVDLNGINGSVHISRAGSSSEVRGINGRVVVTLSGIGSDGLTISGVNGGVELRVIDRVDADLKIRGVSGSIHTEIDELVVRGRVSRESLTATIGSGGPLLTISGINGQVRIVRGFGSGE